MMIPNHHPINRDGLVLWLGYKNTGSVAATGTWKDYSGNGNDGTLIADAYVDSGGLHLDGTGDYVSFSSNPLRFGQSDFTASMWVKRDGTGTEGLLHLQEDSSLNPGSWWLRFESDNTCRFLIDKGLSADDTKTTDTFGSGVWYHLVARRDSGSTLKIYINGIEKASGVDTGFDLSGNDGDFIGKVSSAYFNGQIDDMMIFNRALSAGEIQGLYQRTLRA